MDWEPLGHGCVAAGLLWLTVTLLNWYKQNKQAAQAGNMTDQYEEEED